MQGADHAAKLYSLALQVAMEDQVRLGGEDAASKTTKMRWKVKQVTPQYVLVVATGRGSREEAKVPIANRE